jgi:regulator of sigma E protease
VVSTVPAHCKPHLRVEGMLTVSAFLFALALLIAVHEYGHYRVAVLCGVKVLRFSIGFGKPLWSWTSPTSGTEFALSAIPLGGYVKMLDGREGPVPTEQRHLAFDTQPLRKRVAIVAAGPLANLLLAVLLYAGVQMLGTEAPVPVVAAPVAGSVAQAAGLQSGDRVVAASVNANDWKVIDDFDTLRWILTKGAMDAHEVLLKVERQDSARQRTLSLNLSLIDSREIDAQLLRRIGLLGPWTKPVIGEVMAGGAASSAGLRQGDLVKAIGSKSVLDGTQLRELIRNSVGKGKEESVLWQIERNGNVMDLEVRPRIELVDGVPTGRIGAYVGTPPQTVLKRLGPLDAMAHGVSQTWEISSLTLRTIGRMLIGQASLKNLSGPVTIAEYAGKSANLGWIPFLTFLALISVSLGVLNLLPLPVLDGGHLMYYLWEGVTGRAITDVWAERLQRGGLVVMFLMMSVALFNDFSRLLG